MNEIDVFRDIANLLEAARVQKPSDPGLTANKIIELSSESLEKMEPLTLEELLSQIASYNIFLKSQKGSLEAQLVVLEAELKRRLYVETLEAPKTHNGVYLTKEEKESWALTNVLNGLHQKVVTLRATYARIKDVPFAIDRKLDLLKMKYRRMMGGH